LFAYANGSEGSFQRLAELMGVRDLPTMRILDPNAKMRKYDYPFKVEDITVDSIKKFIKDF